MSRRLLVGWGLTAPTASEVVPLEGSVVFGGDRGVLARGLGRSYGDAAQNAGGTVIDATTHDQMISVCAAEGTARVAAGVSIDQLLRVVVPMGFFVPVTPGTRFVTIGGAIAADVHGKNHHRDGSLGSHVLSITLATPVGVMTLDPSMDLFWATTGGMGLTGVILDALLQLPRIETSLLAVDTDRTSDLDEVLDLMTTGDDGYQFSVAWIDCLSKGRHLGRSVLTRGDFAPASAVGRADPLEYKAAVRVHAPPLVPSGLVNPLSMRIFNEGVYRRGPGRRRGELQTITQFFHPLDVIGGWNRMYGRRGFLQYQCVVPFAETATLRRLIERLSGEGAASFLAVLKRFGPADPGPLSFPAPGWTLALDLAVVPGLGALLDELDDLVVSVGGRVYLAKDSRVRRSLIPLMYPRLDEWRAVRDRVDPAGVLVSDLDRRLDLTGHGSDRVRP